MVRRKESVDSGYDTDDEWRKKEYSGHGGEDGNCMQKVK